MEAGSASEDSDSGSGDDDEPRSRTHVRWRIGGQSNFQLPSSYALTCPPRPAGLQKSIPKIPRGWMRKTPSYSSPFKGKDERGLGGEGPEVLIGK